MAEGGSIAVIAHPAVPKADQQTLQRLYTGRVVSINQQAALPLNLAPGDPIRKQFLEAVLGQTEEQYVGYWLVRRYVGKGAPPQEFGSLDEMLYYIATTPGAVGYVPVAKVPLGANVIFRR
jgi:ABC-type phosphate transport system substrate-binding protein